MKSLFELFKLEFYKYKDLLQLITGITTLLIGISFLIGKVFESKYTIALICIGIFFIIKKILNEIINARKESFGLVVPKYSSKFRNRAKVLNIFNYLFLTFPLILIGNDTLDKFNTVSKQHFYINGVGILITNFSNSNEDDFSYKLFTSLNGELAHTDTINTLRLSKFINAGGPGYTDSIKDMFINNNFERGILVFGKRSIESQLFECTIFLNNILIATPRISRRFDKNVIDIQNPDLIKFSIEYQSQIVSEFILGLLYYHANDLITSREKFRNSLTLNSNKNNKRFKAYCQLFIGQSFHKSKEFFEATKEYRIGIGYDSLNAYLHFNLGNVLLESSDSLAAYSEYVKAYRLNDKLPNPIENFVPGRHKKIINYADAVTSKKSVKEDVKSNRDSLISSKTKVNISSYTVIVIGNKYGIINNTSDTIVPCEYDFIDQYVYTYDAKKFFIARKNSKYGALTEQGKIEVPFKHESSAAVKNIINLIMEVNKGY